MPKFPVEGNVSIPLATAERQGLMSSSDKVKLDSLGKQDPTPNLAHETIAVQRTSGDAPESDIVLLADNCIAVRLPKIAGCARTHILFHNTTISIATIVAHGGDQIFGYQCGFALPANESVHLVIQPDTSIWRVL